MKCYLFISEVLKCNTRFSITFLHLNQKKKNTRKLSICLWAFEVQFLSALDITHLFPNFFWLAAPFFNKGYIECLCLSHCTTHHNKLKLDKFFIDIMKIFISLYLRISYTFLFSDSILVSQQSNFPTDSPYLKQLDKLFCNCIG